AMDKNGKLLLIEMVVPEGNQPDLSKFLDLDMMVMTGGRERTEAEFKSLLAASGFKLTRVIRTASPICVIEAVRAGAVADCGLRIDTTFNLDFAFAVEQIHKSAIPNPQSPIPIPPSSLPVVNICPVTIDNFKTGGLRRVGVLGDIHCEDDRLETALRFF